MRLSVQLLFQRLIAAQDLKNTTNEESTLLKTLREKPKCEDSFGKKPKNIVVDGDTANGESSLKSKANHVTA